MSCSGLKREAGFLEGADIGEMRNIVSEVPHISGGSLCTKPLCVCVCGSMCGTVLRLCVCAAACV